MKEYREFVFLIVLLLLVAGCLNQQYVAQPGDNLYESIEITNMSFSVDNDTGTLQVTGEPALWCKGESGRTPFLLQSWLVFDNGTALGPAKDHVVLNKHNEIFNKTFTFNTTWVNTNNIQSVDLMFQPPENISLSNRLPCSDIASPEGAPTIFTTYRLYVANGTVTRLKKPFNYSRYESENVATQSSMQK